MKIPPLAKRQQADVQNACQLIKYVHLMLASGLRKGEGIAAKTAPPTPAIPALTGGYPPSVVSSWTANKASMQIDPSGGSGFTETAQVWRLEGKFIVVNLLPLFYLGDDFGSPLLSLLPKPIAADTIELPFLGEKVTNNTAAIDVPANNLEAMFVKACQQYLALYPGNLFRYNSGSPPQQTVKFSIDWGNETNPPTLAFLVFLREIEGEPGLLNIALPYQLN
jgi:hypothetical protein